MIRLRNHHRGQYPTEDTLRLATYLMEQALAISREKVRLLLYIGRYHLRMEYVERVHWHII